MHLRSFALLLLLPAMSALAQVQTLAPGLRKLGGVESAQQIRYARIFLNGVDVPGNSLPDAAAIAADHVPVLIAECTQDSKGKQRFELHMTYGDVEDTAYYPPWHPANDRDLFPPPTARTILTMDFFGYTRVKPVKRQWEYVTNPAGELRYNPPSSRSTNLEEIMFYLQYLKALPTLRLTPTDKRLDKAVQFEITPLFDAMRKEPLCKASGI